MPVINDLRNELFSYVANYATIEIVNFTVSAGAGPAWNVGDTGSFQVRVCNNGDMDIKNLRVHIAAINNFGKVRFLVPGPAGGAWQNDFVWPLGIQIDAHGSNTFGAFQFKAERKTNGTKEVIRAHIENFDLSWDHLLVDHTGHTAAASDAHSIEIFPT